MLNVLTGSMSPTFDAGSLIIIEKVDINLIKDEDIITFKPLQERDILVTHRVIEVLNENSSISLITQGDANTVPDAQEITSKELVGRVVFYANGIGLFLVKLKTPAGIIALVFVVLAITLLLNLPSILKKMNENN
jgi:signal peptidase